MVTKGLWISQPASEGWDYFSSGDNTEDEMGKVSTSFFASLQLRDLEPHIWCHLTPNSMHFFPTKHCFP